MNSQDSVAAASATTLAAQVTTLRQLRTSSMRKPRNARFSGMKEVFVVDSLKPVMLSLTVSLNSRPARYTARARL
jgi:hypothetical protein